MVDEKIALNFSVKNNPGVFALLLGSGISTEAEIPTGWGVLKDLIEKMAESEGEEPESDPIQWYEDKYDEEPQYDRILEKLARSKEERQALLEDYFEPDADDAEDVKTRSKAHESIAWLVDKGYIRVIVTTNFDRLLERALRNRGITPTVISTPEAANGAAPLAHEDAVILKINGDYKETNIKNTRSELEEYDPATRDLLDQIFEEYGLIVCGWSGKWDIGLRNAILECESRRYSTFWAYHGELEDKAKELIDHRDGIRIQIDGASNFFSSLKDSVQALEDAESGAPLTGEVAKERVKRYMMREEHRIDLADLLKEEREQVYDRIFDEDRYPLAEDLNKKSVEERLRSYQSVVGTLAVACSTCAYWSSEAVNSGVDELSDIIRRTGSIPTPQGRFNRTWRDLRKYPATYILYASGVAAIEQNNWELIRQLVHTELNRSRYAVAELHPNRVGSRLPNYTSWKTFKIKIMLREGLPQCLADVIPEDNRYQNALSQFDLVMDMGAKNEVIENGRDPTNWRIRSLYDSEDIEAWQEKLESKKEELEPLQAGLFNGSVDRMELLLDSCGTVFF